MFTTLSDFYILERKLIFLLTLLFLFLNFLMLYSMFEILNKDENNHTIVGLFICYELFSMVVGFLIPVYHSSRIGCIKMVCYDKYRKILGTKCRANIPTTTKIYRSSEFDIDVHVSKPVNFFSQNS